MVVVGRYRAEGHPQRRKESDERVLYKGVLRLLALRDLTEVGRFTPHAKLGPRRLWPTRTAAEARRRR